MAAPPTHERRPSRLRVPVRLRVRPLPGGELPIGDVADAVAEAVAIACQGAVLSALDLDPRSRAVVTPTVHLATPRDDVPRTLLDAAVVGARRGAAAAGFVDAGASMTPRSPARPIGLPSEPYDPSRVRYHPNGLTYVVPFFDGGETEVPLRDESARSTPWIPAPGEVVGVERAIEIAWRWHLYRNQGWAIHRELPGYHGLIRVGGRTRVRFVFLYDVLQVGSDGAPTPGRFRRIIMDDDGAFGMVGILGGPSSAAFSLWWAGSEARGEWSYSSDGDSIPIVFATQRQLPSAGRGTGSRGGIGREAGAGGAGGSGGDAPADGEIGDDLAPLDVNQPPGAARWSRAELARRPGREGRQPDVHVLLRRA